MEPTQAATACGCTNDVNGSRGNSWDLANFKVDSSGEAAKSGSVNVFPASVAVGPGLRACPERFLAVLSGERSGAARGRRNPLR